MQETLQEWNLMYEPAPMAWEARLFLFYLLLACGLLFLKSASVIRILWRTRKPDAPDGSPQTETKFLQDLQLCSTKVTSLKRAAVLTFILSFLAFLDESIRTLVVGFKHVSPSFVERQNWTVRTTMRRYTRLSNGFSRKLENHAAATALNYFAYNFIKIHRTLRMSPAMAAGV